MKDYLCLKDRKFIHLPFLIRKGIEIGKNLGRIIEWKNFLIPDALEQS
jgi:hypothetical protein